MKIVFFGDSITARTEGHEKPLLSIKLEEKLNGNWEIINAGVSGNNTFDALKRIEKDVLAHNPDIVAVLLGANDAAFHKIVPVHEFQKNLTHIVKRITPSKTILITPAPIDENLQHARTNTVLKQYSNAVEMVSRKTDSFYIDLFSSMSTLQNLPEVLRGQKNDGLHFGELGYDHLANEIGQKLSSTINAK